MATLRKTCLIFLGLLSSGVSQTCFAEDTSKLNPRSFPTSNTQSFSYRSDSMNRVYDISIGLPHGYNQDQNKEYPALIVTDGNRVFPILHGIFSGIAAAQPETIDQPIVISVGAPFEEGEQAYGRRRLYEFSPPDWEMTDQFGLIIKDLCENTYRLSTNECVGGAPRFLEFITNELLPDLQTEFRIDQDDLGLFGVSAGGFFTTWVMFQDNSPFSRYLISSPAMAYGDGELFRLEAGYAETHDDLPVGVYFGSGTLEMNDPYLEAVGKIVSGQAHLGGLLQSRNYPSLKLHSEIHQGMGHMDTPAVVAARGLRLLYKKAGLPD